MTQEQITALIKKNTYVWCGFLVSTLVIQILLEQFNRDSGSNQFLGRLLTWIVFVNLSQAVLRKGLPKPTQG